MVRPETIEKIKVSRNKIDGVVLNHPTEIIDFCEIPIESVPPWALGKPADVRPDAKLSISLASRWRHHYRHRNAQISGIEMPTLHSVLAVLADKDTHRGMYVDRLDANIEDLEYVISKVDHKIGESDFIKSR